MKSIIYHEYGTPDVLKLEQIEKPIPQDDEILVKVYATTANIGELVIIKGEPYIMRLMFGLRKPKSGSFGEDIAGTVEAVGANVTQFQPGDGVFGWAKGSFSEYVCASEENFLLKPTNLTFEQAGAVGVSAFTALQALRTQGNIQSGQKVLINGASGGVGSFAVQIAKAYGAEVTGVCSTNNVDMVRALGADHVVDYKQEDFTQNGQQYDLILDNVGNHSLSGFKRVLAPQGKVLPNAGGHGKGRWFGDMGNIIKVAISSLFSRQQGQPFLALPNKEDLAILKELVESGDVTPFIEKTYPLRDSASAFKHVETGRTRGKIVINVAQI